MFRISLDTHVFYEESNRNIHVRKYTFKIQFKKVLKASIPSLVKDYEAAIEHGKNATKSLYHKKIYNK